MRVTLRDYQQSAVDRIRAAYGAGHRSVLFCLPTGGGKTVVFCYVAEAAAEKGRRVVILVHRQELVSQSVDALENLGLEVGVIAPGYDEQPDRQIQVASVQSLARRLKRWAGAFDFIVIDEAHHAAAGSWQKCCDAFPDAYRLGVTATPERLDGKALRPWFSELICGPGTWDLMQAGHLSQCKILCPPTGVDFKKLRVLGGDFRKDDAAQAMGRPTLMGDVVGHYQQHIAPATAIAFCVTVAHAEAVASMFVAAGVRAATIDGTLSRNARRELIDGLRTGEVQVLCSCEVISEGTDVPSVGGAILCRPTNSLSLFLQQVGRCLRPAPGKKRRSFLITPATFVATGSRRMCGSGAWMGPKFASKMKSDATPHGSRSALNVSRQSLAGVLLITAPTAGRLSRNPRPSLPGALAKGHCAKSESKTR